MSLTDPIRLLRNWMAHLSYSFLEHIVLLPLRFHCKRSIIGRCTILAPEKQMQTFLAGVEYLRTLDAEMFRQLTDEHQYLFWYHPKQFLRGRNTFAITDHFLRWGKEGIVIGFVQSILNYKIGYLKWEKTLCHSREMRAAIRHEIRQKLFEWISKHPFSPELVKYYRELAEN
jgi:hypothetical protein